MRLQVALDATSLASALDLADQIADSVDIFEVGSTLLKAEGMAAVRAIKQAHPERLVFADTMIADDGQVEAELAFAAGADLISVLGIAHDDVIRDAVAVARQARGAVVADLLGVGSPIERAREVRALGVGFVAFHAGQDERATRDRPLRDRLNAGEIARVPFSVVGGISMEHMQAVQWAGADIVVAGRALAHAANPAAAAREMRAAII